MSDEHDANSDVDAHLRNAANRLGAALPVAAPPAVEVLAAARRRRRTWMAVASAAAVVLITGAVLVLRPNGPSRLEVAGDDRPTTTATSLTSPPVTVPTSTTAVPTTTTPAVVPTSLTVATTTPTTLAPEPPTTTTPDTLPPDTAPLVTAPPVTDPPTTAPPPTVPATTTPPTTAWAWCAEQSDACRAHNWEPDPAPDRQLAIALGFTAPTVKVGQPVVFTYTVSDPDAPVAVGCPNGVTVNSGWSGGLGSDMNPPGSFPFECTLACVVRSVTAPSATPTATEGTVHHNQTLTFDTPGTYTATITAQSGPADACEANPWGTTSPYAGKATATATITVTP